jgi:GNAT superfamily N-acetyltransferase
VKLAVGDVVYITGDSGSGKSVLLRALREDLGDEAASMTELEAPDDKPIIDLVGGSFREALRLLSMVGLNDAFLFLRRPSHLSDGQRYRFRIAQLLNQRRPYWLCDEFCSTLDRSTAKIVAYNIQKLARRSGATLIVATTHTDLLDDLCPSIHIHKSWGTDIDIRYHSNVESASCTVAREVTVQESSKEDYMRLAYLHYRDHRVVAPHRFYSMKLGDELIGVIAYTYPTPTAAGRLKAVGYAPRLRELNEEWTLISRVIVHPKYRTIGLGARLIRDTLRLTGRRHVELIAVMAQYNPFAEKAGMKKILVKEPTEKIVEAINRLKALGFNPAMLASRRYNERKLASLPPEKHTEVDEALLQVDAHCYRRLARTKKPYLRKAEFKEWLGAADTASLAWTLQILGVLSQTKAYLYWCSDWREGHDR